MRGFIGLTFRNMKVYLKDRQAVFFSLLTPLIILVLYVLFLRGTFVDGLESSLGTAKNLVSSEDINTYANLLLLAGVTGSSVITVAFSSLSTIVNDKENKIDYDISVTPIKRPVIVLSYLTAGFICSFVVSLVILLASFGIVSMIGNTYLLFVDVLKLIGLTCLGSLSATAFLMIIVLMFKTSSSAGGFQGLLCAATGFVIGAYIPLSQFHTSVQTIANLFPGSHVTAIYRNILLSPVSNHIDSAIGGLDNHEVVKSINTVFSVNLNMFDNTVASWVSVIYVVCFVVLSIAIVSVLYTKLYKRK